MYMDVYLHISLSFQSPNDFSSPQALEYSSSLERYSYLWVDDRREFLRQFLLYGHVLTAEEIEAAGEEGVKEMPPSLGQFKEQVDGYEAIYSQVDGSKVRGMRNMWDGLYSMFDCLCYIHVRTGLVYMYPTTYVHTYVHVCT